MTDEPQDLTIDHVDMPPTTDDSPPDTQGDPDTTADND
jgi:hypothetical protein